MRIFNPDYHAPESNMRAALRKADLESHGYTKEVTTALTSKPGNTAFFEKKHLYYKTVDCSRASEVVQELETLFSDAYAITVGTKILSEIKARNLTSMKKCKVGVEIHFKNGGGCSSSKSNTRSKRSPCFYALFVVGFNHQLTRQQELIASLKMEKHTSF